MNYSQSRQGSQAFSGFRGTDYQQQGASQAYNRGLKLNEAVDTANADLTKYQGQTGSQLLPGGQYGLGSNVDAAVQQYGKYMFGQASGSAGQRGQLSPENLAGVTSSAVTNSLPTLMPYIQQWQLAQFQAPVSLNQASIQNAQAPANFWQQGLGAQSQGSGTGVGAGVFQFGGSAGASSGGSGGGK